MKWFKLDADTYRNPDLRILRQKYGWEGFGRYIAILCMVAEQVHDDSMTFDLRINGGDPTPIALLADDLRMKTGHVVEMCGNLAALGLIDREAWESEKRIYVPNMAKRLDDTARKVRTLSGGSPARTEQNRIEQKRTSVKRGAAASGDALLNLDFVLRTSDDEFKMFVAQAQATINRENDTRRQKFVWDTTTGGLEADLRKLIYKTPDDRKRSILTEAYTLLGEKINWPAYVLLAISYTVRSAQRVRINSAYKYTISMMSKPALLAGAHFDGGLRGPSTIPGINGGKRRE